MSAMNETTKPKAADPVYVLMSSNCSRPSGSVAFSGVEKGEPMNGQGGLTANPIYPVNADPGAEAQTVPPVATWIEPPMVICRWCGFMVKYGRGNVEHVEFCQLCKCEVACE